jgi:hypothetical protein
MSPGKVYNKPILLYTTKMGIMTAIPGSILMARNSKDKLLLVFSPIFSFASPNAAGIAKSITMEVEIIDASREFLR